MGHVRQGGARSAEVDGTRSVVHILIPEEIIENRCEASARSRHHGEENATARVGVSHHPTNKRPAGPGRLRIRITQLDRSVASARVSKFQLPIANCHNCQLSAKKSRNSTKNPFRNLAPKLHEHLLEEVHDLVSHVARHVSPWWLLQGKKGYR